MSIAHYGGKPGEGDVVCAITVSCMVRGGETHRDKEARLKEHAWGVPSMYVGVPSMSAGDAAAKNHVEVAAPRTQWRTPQSGCRPVPGLEVQPPGHTN